MTGSNLQHYGGRYEFGGFLFSWTALSSVPLHDFRAPLHCQHMLAPHGTAWIRRYSEGLPYHALVDMRYANIHTTVESGEVKLLRPTIMSMIKVATGVAIAIGFAWLMLVSL